MKAIRVRMDERLLNDLDAAARREHLDRSKLIRHAVARYLRKLRTQEQVARFVEAHRKRLQEFAEAARWEGVAAWPRV